MAKSYLVHPIWLKTKLPGGANYTEIRNICRSNELHTVCESALCPNIANCWGEGKVTFMILGNICTRNCAFCSVKHGKPVPPDLDEPHKIATAVKKLNLKYVVITSVTRDDLDDGGACLFAETIKEIKKLFPDTKVEVLVPDFGGRVESLEVVLGAKPEVLSHNIETIPNLYKSVRPLANYQRSLSILSAAKDIAPSVKTKTGISGNG